MGRRRPILRKLTMLTAAEDKAWVWAFCYYLDRTKSEDRADALAWRDLKMEFPRLRGFDGCLAEPARHDTKFSPCPVVVGR